MGTHMLETPLEWSMPFDKVLHHFKNKRGLVRISQEWLGYVSSKEEETNTHMHQRKLD